jgi:hypothetical protein
MQTILNVSEQSEGKARARPKETKEAKILAIMRDRPSGLNWFEAEHFGCLCLHSTIATLRRKGYQFRAEWEWVSTRFGDVHVKRYFYRDYHPAASCPLIVGKGK